MGGAILLLHVHDDSSASGLAPEEEGPVSAHAGSPLPMVFHSSSYMVTELVMSQKNGCFCISFWLWHRLGWTLCYRRILSNRWQHEPCNGGSSQLDAKPHVIMAMMCRICKCRIDWLTARALKNRVLLHRKTFPNLQIWQFTPVCFRARGSKLEN